LEIFRFDHVSVLSLTVVFGYGLKDGWRMNWCQPRKALTLTNPHFPLGTISKRRSLIKEAIAQNRNSEDSNPDFKHIRLFHRASAQSDIPFFLKRTTPPASAGENPQSVLTSLKRTFFAAQRRKRKLPLPVLLLAFNDQLGDSV